MRIRDGIHRKPMPTVDGAWLDWGKIREFKERFPTVAKLSEDIWDAAKSGDSMGYDDHTEYDYSDFESFLMSDHEAAVLLRSNAEKLEAVLKRE